MNSKSTSRLSILVIAVLASLPFTARAERISGTDAEERAAGIAVGHLRAQRAAMRLPDATEFAVRSSESDELGQTHVRIDQTFAGVPVFGGEIIVHVDRESGAVLKVTDDAKRGIDVDTTPEITEGHALAIANADLMPMGGFNVEPTVRLVVWQDERSGTSALAYQVHTELENDFQTRHTDYIVDAHSGAILKSWDSLETTAATGTGYSEYSGTVTLNTNTKSTGGYELRDMTRGTGGNTTRNLNHATSGTGTIYSDSDNVWGNGADYSSTSYSTTAATGETAAVDAAYGLQKTWDYYKNVHARNGIDNAGTATYNRVHYSSYYDNAFWSDSCFCMTYGDGNSFSVLTAIDVAGHEMSHGVCSRTAGLVYSGESGGLNESNSDIFGTMVEFYARGGSGNWTIGEQLSSAPLRYMYKPSLDGRSPNCWSSSVGSLDVHYSSGIGNRFFYFLVNGTTSLSGSACNGAAITGIGRSAAEKIWYRALTRYMTSTTNYKGARTATLNAAADLYGSTSTQYKAVAAAWSGVAVN